MSIFLKVLAIVVTLAGAVFVAGLTGVLFRVWPTSWPDQQLRVTDFEIAALRRLRAVPKFYPDTKLFYPGAAEEVTRAKCKALMRRKLVTRIFLPTLTSRKVCCSGSAAYSSALIQSGRAFGFGQLTR
jgi:hypothetical protein